MPHSTLARRRLILGGLFAGTAVAVLYLLLPRLAGLDDTWRRLSEDEPAWLAVALMLEALSFAGYVVVFRAAFSREPAPVGWRASYRITMAGVVATRLLATAGAGGVALTAWALHREGLDGRRVVSGMTTFIGMLGNLLPLPGGVGGVDGAMIAALIGFGVADGLAIVAVLVYRGFAFWLPMLPGVVAYVELVRASTGPAALAPPHGRR